MANKIPPKIMAQLNIVEDNLDHDMITQILGINPTEIKKEGIKLPGNCMPARYTSWELSTELMESYEIEEPISLLLDKIRDKIDILAQYVIDHKITVYIDCLVKIYDEQPAFCIDSEIIKLLSKINASLDVDIYYLVEGSNL